MRTICAITALSLLAFPCAAQEALNDATFLKQARAKYDAPFTRNMVSFDCAVEFNWKQHFKETVRLGDEGTDEEIAARIQPIRNRVTVTGRGAAVSTGMTEQQVTQLPHGGMAELLLQHAVQYSMNEWLLSGTNSLLPPEGTALHVTPSASGYDAALKIQTFDVQLSFTQDMRLKSEQVQGSGPDRQEAEFLAGPQGFLLSSLSLGEDGDFTPGNRIILTFTYQTVGGFQVPETVWLNRESHHENWRYALRDCKVNTK